MATEDHSLVELYADLQFSECGYCKDSSPSSQTFGMNLRRLTADDMMGLTNRNWRRSGTYGYHPEMDKTCCPPYMIKCDAINFRMNKKQRKAIYKMNRFLATGVTTATNSDVKLPAAGGDSFQTDSAGPSPSKSTTKKVVKPGKGADPAKPKCLKAKERRKLRKLEKPTNQPAVTPSPQSSDVAKDAESGSDQLESLLAAMTNEENVHNLELVLIRSDELDGEAFNEELQIYKQYQVEVHGDPPYEVTAEGFRRFLVTSPIMYEKRNDVTLGSYHLQYKLDDKIIAVEVMDILPEVVSSVYFFYDPKFGYLSLGRFSALVSIQTVRELNQLLPQLEYYSLGFYIHSCHKMRYKGDYDKSYLLCPETYEWVPIEICRPKLDANKYSRLTEDPDKVDPDKPVGDDMKAAVDACLCVYKEVMMPYVYMLNPSADDVPPHVQRTLLLIDTDEDEIEEIEQYVSLIGTKLSKSILLFLG